MIPGTTLALGGGGALSRDVGGSGNLQQSPLQYRGSGDTVQTIEGMRLNNLCAQGAYSRRLLERRQLRRVQLCDRRRLGRSGPGRHARQHGAARRRQLVPRLGGLQLRRRELRLRQLRLARRHRPALHALEPERQQDVQPQQHADQRRRDQEDLGRQSIDRRSDPQEQGLVQLHVPALGSTKTKADAYVDKNPSQFIYDPDFTQARRRRWPHRQQRRPHLVAGVSSKDKISVYHDDQRKYRNHWGIAATIPPEAAGVQVTPTSFVNVTKWTRTHTNKLLLEGGFGYYNQEYTELYQPSVTGHDDKVWERRGDQQRAGLQRPRSVEQPPGQRVAEPRRSLLGPAHVHGRGVVRRRLAQLPRRRELDDRRLEAADAVDRRHAADHLQRRPAGVGDAAPAVGSQQRHQSRPRHLRCRTSGRWAASR